jgi:hypothetical protein
MPHFVLTSEANPNPEKLSSTVLEKDFWLSDEHIDHAQWLLQQHFAGCNGLHSLLAFEGKTPKIQRGQKEFVQIINVGRKHWVTVTNIGCEDNVVKVYDSKYMELPEKDRNKFYLCLAALLNTSYPNMTIVWPSMQNQKGCSDCGLFAVAVAFSLLIGEDPSTQAYDQKTMRVHLAMGFQVGELAQFPVNASVLPMQHERKEVVELFCHCRMPYSGSFMIEFATCAEWFHRSCENMPRKVNAKTIFCCANCK